MKRRVRIQNKVRIAETPDPVVPVLQDTHVPDADLIKTLFKAFSEEHRLALMKVAVSYISVNSILDEVVSDIREVVTTDFRLDDSTKMNIDLAFSRAITYYLNKHALELVGASTVDKHSIITSLFTPESTQQKPPQLTAKDLVEALGQVVRATPVVTDPYGARPPRDKEG